MDLHGGCLSGDDERDARSVDGGVDIGPFDPNRARIASEVIHNPAPRVERCNLGDEGDPVRVGDVRVGRGKGDREARGETERG